MKPASHKPLELDDFASREAATITPACAVDRLPRRRRNQICVAIIAIGMLNFVAYTVLYAAMGGDAHNGERRYVTTPEGNKREAYFVRGHFLRTVEGREREVSRGWWIYSYLHSISVLATSGAMIISMLVLARPHIMATMRDGWVSGQTIVVAFGTIVLLLTVVTVAMFAWDFSDQLAL
ncbi:MAG: hypothetical protein ACKVS9_04040 [Phycisphaerae bacterium]